MMETPFNAAIASKRVATGSALVCVGLDEFEQQMHCWILDFLAKCATLHARGFTKGGWGAGIKQTCVVVSVLFSILLFFSFLMLKIAFSGSRTRQRCCPATLSGDDESSSEDKFCLLRDVIIAGTSDRHKLAPNQQGLSSQQNSDEPMRKNSNAFCPWMTWNLMLAYCYGRLGHRSNKWRSRRLDVLE